MNELEQELQRILTVLEDTISALEKAKLELKTSSSMIKLYNQKTEKQEET